MDKYTSKLVDKIVRIDFSDGTYVDVSIKTFIGTTKDELERQAITILKEKLEARSRQLWG